MKCKNIYHTGELTLYPGQAIELPEEPGEILLVDEIPPDILLKGEAALHVRRLLAEGLRTSRPERMERALREIRRILDV